MKKVSLKKEEAKKTYKLMKRWFNIRNISKLDQNNTKEIVILRY